MSVIIATSVVSVRMGNADSTRCCGERRTNKVNAKINLEKETKLSEEQKDLLAKSWTVLKGEISKIGVVTFMK